MRNKLITLLLTLTAFISSNAQTLDEKYVEGYYLVPASINTAAKENNISLYRNSQIIILKPDPKGKNNKPVPFTATIKGNGDIGKPKISKELSTMGISGTVAFDSIAGKMYYSKYNSLERNFALYESTVEKGKWMPAKKMTIDGTGGQRETGNFMVSAGWSYKPTGLTGFKNPSISKNGKRIYFTANIRGRKNGNIGSTDIWFIDQKEDGKSWSFPQNLGRNINTTTKEDYAFCLGDTVLYYCTFGRGGRDIYKSVFIDGEWTKGERLPEPFNSGLNDLNLIANSKNMFLVSNRKPMGRDDVFLFREAPEKPIIPDPVPIPPIPEPDPVFVKKLSWNFVLFYFDFDKYILSEEFTIQFKELVDEMKQFPGETFELAGHTDQKGSDRYNMKLSNKRALFVKELLIKEGFPKEKLITKGFGETMPVIEDPETDDDYAQNRRVEIRVLPAEQPTPEVKSDEISNETEDTKENASQESK